MNKEPLLYVLYSLIIALILYIVFRFVLSYTDHFSQITAIVIGCIICIYFVLFYEYNNLKNGFQMIVNN